MRRLSEAPAMVAPPVHDFDGAFRTMVVSEASTWPAANGRSRGAARQPGATKRRAWAS